MKRGCSIGSPLARCLAGVAAAMVVIALRPALTAAPKRDLPAAIAVEIAPKVTMEFVLIPAGTFAMGTPEGTGEEDEWPVHTVTISRPFYLGRYEVTQEQWEAVMHANPSAFRGARRPVDTVSWNDCQDFLARLHALTGRTFALPTEAQWEYAGRAGTTTPWSFGGTGDGAADYAWFQDNAGGTTHPVGEKKPNPWGLYDMYGNIQEWCADCYAKHAYPDCAVTDPAGPAATPGRILRGGAWGDDVDHIRSASRNCLGPEGRNFGTGLRCVLLVLAPDTP